MNDKHKGFGPLVVYVTNDDIEIADRDLGFKYNLCLYMPPKRLARILRRIADWLEEIK